MTTIADISVRFKGDVAQLVADAKSAGAKAGDEAGGGFSQRFGASTKGIATTAISAGFTVLGGVVTSQLIQMDTALAKFKGETGATADEVVLAQGAMSEAYKHNLQSLTEIGGTLSVLRTDMGLTQADADKMLDPFLKFAQVTGQTGPGAVKAFDDILDAFGLHASDATGLMDQLVASHQKYGGSISDNEAALRAMAPQLLALNLKVDDGIGLLNLFATKGIDAAAAQRALNQAVLKLPPGTTLQEFITKLSGIEDPGKRAAEAVRVFGARAGVAMANALGPGVTSLDQFKVSVEEAAGATDKAADAINDSFSNKIQLAVHNVVGSLTQLVAPVGPIATGLATLATGAKALGLNFDIASAGAKGLGLAMKAIPLVLVATGVLEIINKVGQLGTVMAQFSSDRLTAVHAAMQTLKDQFGDVSEATGIWGDAYRKLKAEADALTPAVEGQTPIIDGLTTAFQAVQTAVQDAETAATNFGAAAPPVIVEAIDTMSGSLGTLGSTVTDKVIPPVNKVKEIIRLLPGDLAASMEAGQFGWQKAVLAYGDLLKTDMTEAAETAKLKAVLAGKNLADGLKSKDAEVRAGAQALKAAAEERLFALQYNVPEIALKTGQSYADALARKEASVRTAAAKLGHPLAPGEELPSPDQMKKWAEAAAQAYADGLALKQAAITRAAQNALTGSRNVFKATSPPGPESPLHEIDIWGGRTAQAWVDAMDKVLHTAPARFAPVFAELAAKFAALEAQAAALGFHGTGAFSGWGNTGAGDPGTHPAERPSDNPTDSGATPPDWNSWQADYVPPSFYAPDTSDLGNYKAGGHGGGKGRGGNIPDVHVTVNNPKPEAASTSTKRELQLLAATGLIG